MTNDDKDLKPCPFCGDTKYLRVTYQDSKANASITGDKKYWGVFCMEKCGASIDSIYPTREEAIRVWNTRATPQQPSEPLKELECKHEWVEQNLSDWCKLCGKIRPYAINTNPFNKPSEKKALSVDSIKTILTKIMKKELVDIGEHFCFVCGEPMSEEKRGLLIDYIAQAIFDALPTQKALSREEILDLFQTFQLTVDEYREKDFPCIPEWNFTDLINAIHSALPARKEVKWPEKMEHGCDPNGYCDCSASDANEMRDACIAAYEEAIPAQREVRYPEKKDTFNAMNDIFKAPNMGWNDAIDEMKKLNGG